MQYKIITKISRIINRFIPNNYKELIQENLIQIGLYIKTEELITLILITTFLLSVITVIIAIITNMNIIIFLLFALVTPSLSTVLYIIRKKQRRKDKIEKDIPNFLRQIASLLKAGMGTESALVELSNTTKGPLNDELKRAIIEMRLGNSFNHALLGIANRTDSINLKQAFQIIIRGKESGGNLANILEIVANDLKESIALKKERKASVMMSVMFLLISSIIAAPFALGMIQLYSEFIEKIGKINPLRGVIPIASMGYIIIHSILVSILLGIVIYSDSKQGIKYMLLIVPSSLIVYYLSKFLFMHIMGL